MIFYCNYNRQYATRTGIKNQLLCYKEKMIWKQNQNKNHVSFTKLLCWHASQSDMNHDIKWKQIGPLWGQLHLCETAAQNIFKILYVCIDTYVHNFCNLEGPKDKTEGKCVCFGLNGLDMNGEKYK